MGQLDQAFDADVNYETRELAWELQQTRPDCQRVRLFLENAADLRAALRIANIKEAEVLKKPAFKTLHLEKYLTVSA